MRGAAFGIAEGGVPDERDQRIRLPVLPWDGIAVDVAVGEGVEVDLREQARDLSKARVAEVDRRSLRALSMRTKRRRENSCAGSSES